jgi:hypothetical protein
VAAKMGVHLRPPEHEVPVPETDGESRGDCHRSGSGRGRREGNERHMSSTL